MEKLKKGYVFQAYIHKQVLLILYKIQLNTLYENVNKTLVDNHASIAKYYIAYTFN